MKNAIYKISLLIVSSLTLQARAIEGKITCKIAGYELTGLLQGGRINADYVLDSEGEELNENPVRATLSRDGKLKFVFSTVDSAFDAGTEVTLYLAKDVQTGSNEAVLAVVVYDQNGAGRPAYRRGTCTLN